MAEPSIVTWANTPPPGSSARILRDGYNQAVAFDAPADIRENLLAHAVEAETTLKLKEANHG